MTVVFFLGGGQVFGEKQMFGGCGVLGLSAADGGNNMSNVSDEELSECVPVSSGGILRH